MSDDGLQVFACRCITALNSFFSPTTNSNYFLSELSALAAVGSMDVLKALPPTLASLSGHVDLLCEDAIVKLFGTFMTHKLWLIRKCAMDCAYEMIRDLSEAQQKVVLSMVELMGTDS